MTFSIGELACGVIAAGFEGTVVDSNLPRFGGYVLFASNGTSVAHVRELTDELRAHHGGDPAPLIAIDQEGGRVVRLHEGAEPMPSMMALGAVGDVELAGRAGEQIAFDLRRAGCTLDFAPVLDLALDAENTVIGTRSFGSDPGDVAALGAKLAHGMQRGGIIPCYKHFPGHGSTPVDSHVALPTIDCGEQVLRKRDLVPFAAVAREAPAIMGAHAIVRGFDEHRPATLSRRIIDGLLRGELGFGGVYVTDCLEMGAVDGTRGSVAAAVDALAAGADLLLFSHQTGLAQEAARAIARAVEDGTVPLQRLAEAHARVMRLRASASPPLSLDEFPPHPGVGREIGRRAITLVRGLPHTDPVSSCAVYFTSGGGRLSSSAPVLEEVCAGTDPSAAEVERVFEALAHSGRRPLLLAARAHLHPAAADAIARVADGNPDAIVVSTLEPFDLPLFSNARHVLASYGDDAPSTGGLADVLFGGSLPEGRLPVELAVEV